MNDGARGRICALLIEDNLGDARLLREMLRDVHSLHPVDLEHRTRLSDGIDRIRTAPVDVVLLDLSLPDSTSLATYTTLREACPMVPVVVLSGLDDETISVRAVQEGAQDYLVKGRVDGGTLIRSLRYAIERKRLEVSRVDLERQKEEFFSNVSHDLRTPIAAIKASIGVVIEGSRERLPPPLLRLLGNIELASDELSRLVDDLLALSRLQSGQIRLLTNPVDLRDLVQRAARSVESLATVRGQRIVLDVPAEPVVATVDAERLGRAINNLVGNANKYGREHGTVGIRLFTEGDNALFAVSDDGVGIAPEDVTRIFDRYYRVTGRREPGSGLGLPIARGIVELHGGRIWVESIPNSSTTFFVAVPRNEPS